MVIQKYDLFYSEVETVRIYLVSETRTQSYFFLDASKVVTTYTDTKLLTQVIVAALLYCYTIVILLQCTYRHTMRDTSSGDAKQKLEKVRKTKNKNYQLANFLLHCTHGRELSLINSTGAGDFAQAQVLDERDLENIILMLTVCVVNIPCL